MITKSLGCPAVPYGVHKKIIDLIKGGSCFFVSSPDMWYTRTSTILNAPLDFMPNINGLGLDKEALSNISASNADATISMRDPIK
jgi:hypothetical protein